MTREELKAHCERQIESCETWAKCRGEQPHGKVYEEHKMILELLEQEPKTGHWIVYMDDEWYCCKCSECSKITSFRYMYCPNCGAKMEKENEQRETN